MKLAVFMLLCLIGQLTVEGIAYIFKLWIYTSKKNFILHIILAVIIVFGGLSFIVSGLHWFIRYPIGVAVGLLYEYGNASGLNLFYFPNNKFLVFKNKTFILILMGLLWGLYPLLVPVVYRALIPLIGH